MDISETPQKRSAGLNMEKLEDVPSLGGRTIKLNARAPRKSQVTPFPMSANDKDGDPSTAPRAMRIAVQASMVCAYNLVSFKNTVDSFMDEIRSQLYHRILFQTRV
jgi:hypothetical protein